VHSKLPTIQEEVDQNNPDQPWANDARDGDLRANLDKNRRNCDARDYIDQRHREREERELRRRVEYDHEYGPLGVVHRIMQHDERNRRTQYEADYGHPEGPAPNPYRQPRSLVVALARSRGGAQVGDGGDDMAITTFPAAGSSPQVGGLPPNNFKPNIQKYDDRSDPNIWLSTYYVAVKAVGGNFGHMAAYFPLVMGDAPSLWLNNLPAGSITISMNFS
jgi:hypothetical protein